MLPVEMDGKRAIMDLRPQILAGEHPRGKVFDYVKESDIGTIFEIHTPRLPKPLIKGLENMGLNVIVDELEVNHFRITTVKTDKMIVSAIVEGYRGYIEHRKDRHEKMIISSAFAWTKGNFIESKIAEVCGDLNITYRKAKTGLTWDYLQFIHGDTKSLYLIKNATYFNEDNFSQAVLPNRNRSRGLRRTYLHELSKINKGLEFSNFQSNHEIDSEYHEQLSFFISEEQVKDELE